MCFSRQHMLLKNDYRHAKSESEREGGYGWRNWELFCVTSGKEMKSYMKFIFQWWQDSSLSSYSLQGHSIWCWCNQTNWGHIYWVLAVALCYYQTFPMMIMSGNSVFKRYSNGAWNLGKKWTIKFFILFFFFFGSSHFRISKLRGKTENMKNFLKWQEPCSSKPSEMRLKYKCGQLHLLCLCLVILPSQCFLLDDDTGF